MCSAHFLIKVFTVKQVHCFLFSSMFTITVTTIPKRFKQICYHYTHKHYINHYTLHNMRGFQSGGTWGATYVNGLMQMTCSRNWAIEVKGPKLRSLYCCLYLIKAFVSLQIFVVTLLLWPWIRYQSNNWPAWLFSSGS